MPMRAPSISIQPSTVIGSVVLRDLVVLRHVGIEVVLACEDRLVRDAEVHRLGEAQRRARPPARSAPAASPGRPRHTGQTSCSAPRRTRSRSRRTASSRSRARRGPRGRSPPRSRCHVGTHAMLDFEHTRRPGTSRPRRAPARAPARRREARLADTERHADRRVAGEVAWGSCTRRTGTSPAGRPSSRRARTRPSATSATAARRTSRTHVRSRG